MPSLADLTGNANLLSIFAYSLVQQLMGAALAPYMTAISNEVNSVTPLLPLSPADLALAVIRNIVAEGAAAGEARMSGIDADRFHTLTLLTGDAPAPEQLAIALRRHLIDAGRYDTGIRQGRLRDEWADTIRELATNEPTPAEVLTALVEGQIDEGTAREKFAAFGGMASEFDWLYGTMGAAPSPTEAAAMANRGLIPWGGVGLGRVSFDQAIAEGHARTKWTEAFRGLAEYLPPPRTVTAMHREGALTSAQALGILEKHGLSPELAAAYLKSSTSLKLAKPKELAEATVLTLYRDRLIPRTEAATFIGALGYTPAEAEFILEAEDVRASAAALTHAVARVHTLFVGHKLDQGAATAALAALKVDAPQAAELVGIWDHERAANVHLPTPAQIESAFADEIITQDQAMAMLEAQGYAPWDAWFVLSVKHKSALPGEPAMPSFPAPAGP